MNNTEIVETFIDGWNRMDWDAIDDLMAPDIFYHNIPMEPFEGRAAASAFIRGMDPVSVHWELLSIAENDNKVLTERVDNFELAHHTEVGGFTQTIHEVLQDRPSAVV